MRKTMTYVFAAVAVAMALVSCTKEITTGNEGNKDINADGTRTLTVSFVGATKTTPTIVDNGDGTTSTQPVWAEGDEILLADGSATETYTVTAGQAEESSITITTNLQNQVCAVYPAAAAIESDNVITGVKVLDEQDGTFATANICIAEEETEGTLAFQNATAVFKLTVPAHTESLVVTSFGKTVCPINTEGEDDSAKQKITVNVTDSERPTTCYVAVLVDEENGVLLADLNFDIQYEDDKGEIHHAQGGVPPIYIKSKNLDPSSYKVAAGTIYTPVLHEYVTVGEKKWATMNLGAATVNDYGDFYSWGEINVKPNYGSTQYTQEAKAIKKNIEPGSGNDAARENWGGLWRLPTKDDFINLDKDLGGTGNNSQSVTTFSAESHVIEGKVIKGRYMLKTSFDGITNVGMLYSDGDNYLFFPAAGSSNGTSATQQGKFCHYWSSTYSTSDVAYCMFYEDLLHFSSTKSRSNGRSVRPISD